MHEIREGEEEENVSTTKRKTGTREEGTLGAWGNLLKEKNQIREEDLKH